MHQLFKVVLITLSVLSIYSCSNNKKKSQNSKKNETTNAQNTIAKGYDIYMRNCTACHGAEGNAGVGGASDLQRSVLKDKEFLEVIKNGRNNMPSFKDQLNEEEIQHIIDFFNSFKH